MKHVYRLVACSLLFFCNAAVLFAQWEWAGGIPASNFETVGSAGKWIIASGRYAGDWPVSSTDGGETWSAHSGIGPVAFNPVLVTSATDTFVLAVGSGYSVFRLRDTAQTWMRSDSGLGGAQVRSLAYSRGVGSPNGRVIAASPSSGIFVSTDLGVHWSPSDSGLTTLSTVTVVAIDSTFLAGTTNRGVFRSADNGLTWSPANTGLPDTSIGALATASGWSFAASGTNVYQSSDKGESWSLIPKSVPAVTQDLVLVPTPGRGIGVALFAVTSSGHYRLSADDSDWVKVKAQPNLVQPNFVPFSLAAVDSVLYAVDYDQMNYSCDLGNSWFQAGAYVGAEMSGHVSSRNGHARLYSGPFASTNHGSKWLAIHQAHEDSSHVNVISVSADTSALGYDQLTIGTDSGSVEFSGDGGLSWKSLGKVRPGASSLMCVDVASLDGGVVFASLERTYKHVTVGDTVVGVYRTTNGGASWDRLITPHLTDTNLYAYWLRLHLFRDGSGKSVLFVSNAFHLWRSTDEGDSWWEDTTTSLRGGWKHLNQVHGSLFMCTEGLNILLSYDSEGNPTYMVDSAGVYRSNDYGLSWFNITGDLGAFLTRGFAAVASALEPSRVYLAMTTNTNLSLADVKTSTEGGKRWRPFTGDLRASFSTAFGSAPVVADDQFVYFFGRRRPWTEAELTSVGPERTYRPTMFSLGQNYPNPFNPKTGIRYQVPGVSDVKLVVYDLLGREVAVLVNEKKAAGSYEVSFDGAGLASGIYFYRLTAGSFVQSRKMLLLK